MGQAVGADSVPLPISDRRVMDHSIELAERIDLGRNLLRTCNGFEVANDDRLGFRKGPPGFLRPVGIASMENYLMTLAMSSSPTIRPRPVVEPEMKTRDIAFLPGKDRRALCDQPLTKQT